jgi:hypothetical protein
LAAAQAQEATAQAAHLAEPMVVDSVAPQAAMDAAAGAAIGGMFASGTHAAGGTGAPLTPPPAMPPGVQPHQPEQWVLLAAARCSPSAIDVSSPLLGSGGRAPHRAAALQLAFTNDNKSRKLVMQLESGALWHATRAPNSEFAAPFEHDDGDAGGEGDYLTPSFAVANNKFVLRCRAGVPTLAPLERGSVANRQNQFDETNTTLGRLLDDALGICVHPTDFNLLVVRGASGSFVVLNLVLQDHQRLVRAGASATHIDARPLPCATICHHMPSQCAAARHSTAPIHSRPCIRTPRAALSQEIGHPASHAAFTAKGDVLLVATESELAAYNVPSESIWDAASNKVEKYDASGNKLSTAEVRKH